MATIEDLYKEEITDKEFRKTAVKVLMQITESYNDKYLIYINRLLKLYGRRGVISALITLDSAMMSENFNLGKDFYPFLVYGAKKAFEFSDTNSESLEDTIKKLMRRRK